jgi:hypothetical protein
MLLVQVSILIANYRPARISLGNCSFFAMGVSAIAFLSISPFGRVVSAKEIAKTERVVHELKSLVPRLSHGMNAYAVGLPGHSGVIDYLVTIGVLETKRDSNSYDVLYKRSFTNPEHVGYLFTGVGMKPWDVESCRKIRPTESLVALDGQCVFQAIGSGCGEEIDLSVDFSLNIKTVGISSPEPDGRWTDGSTASLSCSLAQKQPSTVIIDASAFLPGNHSQRVVASVNGSSKSLFLFTSKNPHQVLALPIPGGNSGLLELRFELPDALSPKSVGLNADPRTLGVKLRSIHIE